jgi:hypothetical protein
MWAPCSGEDSYSERREEQLGPEQASSGPACGMMLMCFALAVPPLMYGLAIRLGHYKRYFLVQGPALLLGPGNYHCAILVGPLMIVLGLGGLPADVATRQNAALYLLIPSLVLAMIISLWQPWWLKPKWIRQLQENHPDIYPYLREAAQEEVGTDRKKAEEWASKMDTVKSQNEWVAEVRERLGMPEPRTTEATEEE